MNSTTRLISRIILFLFFIGGRSCARNVNRRAYHWHPSRRRVALAFGEFSADAPFAQFNTKDQGNGKISQLADLGESVIGVMAREIEERRRKKFLEDGLVYPDTSSEDGTSVLWETPLGFPCNPQKELVRCQPKLQSASQNTDMSVRARIQAAKTNRDARLTARDALSLDAQRPLDRERRIALDRKKASRISDAAGAADAARLDNTLKAQTKSELSEVMGEEHIVDDLLADEKAFESFFETFLHASNSTTGETGEVREPLDPTGNVLQADNSSQNIESAEALAAKAFSEKDIWDSLREEMEALRNDQALAEQEFADQGLGNGFAGHRASGRRANSRVVHQGSQRRAAEPRRAMRRE